MNNDQEKITVLTDNKFMDVEGPKKLPFINRTLFLVAGILVIIMIVIISTALYLKNQGKKETMIVPEKVTGMQILQKPQSATEGGIIPEVSK